MSAKYPCECGYVQECPLLDGKCRHCHTKRIMRREVVEVHKNIHRDYAVAELIARHPKEFQAILDSFGCNEQDCAAILRYFNSIPDEAALPKE